MKRNREGTIAHQFHETNAEQENESSETSITEKFSNTAVKKSKQEFKNTFKKSIQRKFTNLVPVQKTASNIKRNQKIKQDKQVKIAVGPAKLLNKVVDYTDIAQKTASRYQEAKKEGHNHPGIAAAAVAIADLLPKLSALDKSATSVQFGIQAAQFVLDAQAKITKKTLDNIPNRYATAREELQDTADVCKAGLEIFAYLDTLPLDVKKTVTKGIEKGLVASYESLVLLAEQLDVGQKKTRHRKVIPTVTKTVMKSSSRVSAVTSNHQNTTTHTQRSVEQNTQAVPAGKARVLKPPAKVITPLAPRKPLFTSETSPLKFDSQYEKTFESKSSSSFSTGLAIVGGGGIGGIAAQATLQLPHGFSITTTLSSKGGAIGLSGPLTVGTAIGVAAGAGVVWVGNELYEAYQIHRQHRRTPCPDFSQAEWNTQLDHFCQQTSIDRASLTVNEISKLYAHEKMRRELEHALQVNISAGRAEAHAYWSNHKIIANVWNATTSFAPCLGSMPVPSEYDKRTKQIQEDLEKNEKELAASIVDIGTRLNKEAEEKAKEEAKSVCQPPQEPIELNEPHEDECEKEDDDDTDDSETIAYSNACESIREDVPEQDATQVLDSLASIQTSADRIEQAVAFIFDDDAEYQEASDYKEYSQQTYANFFQATDFLSESAQRRSAQHRQQRTDRCTKTYAVRDDQEQEINENIMGNNVW